MVAIDKVEVRLVPLFLVHVSQLFLHMLQSVDPYGEHTFPFYKNTILKEPVPPLSLATVSLLEQFLLHALFSLVLSFKVRLGPWQGRGFSACREGVCSPLPKRFPTPEYDVSSKFEDRIWRLSAASLVLCCLPFRIRYKIHRFFLLACQRLVARVAGVSYQNYALVKALARFLLLVSPLR